MADESKESGITRRDFLKKGSATTTAGLAAFTGISFFTHPERIFGANDRVQVAVCGVHGRGMAHVNAYSKLPKAQLVAVCDIDENVLSQRLGQIEKMNMPKPKTYFDIRKLLEDKSVDAISIATPNHWHSLMAIWGCQAGKDVYVEKPCSHNLWEGKQLVRAAQRYNRIVQHGTQSRSDKNAREAIQKIRDGVIGDLYLS